MISLNFSKYFFILFFYIFTSFLNGQLYRHRSPEILSPRDKGMGGSHTATGNDFYLLWANPALIANEKRLLKTRPKEAIYQIFNLELGIPYSFIPALTEISSVFEGLSTTENSFLELTKTTRIIDRLPLGLYTQPPLSFGVIGHRWGFSLASHSEFFLTASGGLLPSIYFDISAGFDAKLGFSPLILSLFEKDDFKTGIAVKGLGFVFSKPNLSTIDLLSFFPDLQIDILVEAVLETQTTGFGFGLDTGILFDFFKNFTLGVAIIDIFTPFYSIEREDIKSINVLPSTHTFSFLYPNLKMGLAYRFPEHPFFLFKNGVLSFDLHHLYDDTYTIGKQLHIGTSVDIFDIGLIGANTAAGFNQGYFTFSTTLKLPGFLFLIPPSYFSYTFYQKELGRYANSYARSLHILSFSMKF